MATEEKPSYQATCRHSNDLTNLDSIEMIEHISSCDICAAAFAEKIEKESFIKAPHYMKANIMQKSLKKKDNEKAKEILKKLPSKQFRLFTYSLKVGFAMCGALVLLFSVDWNPSQRTGSYTDKKEIKISITNKINDRLNEFSNNMVEYADELVSDNKNMEENKND